MLLRSHSCCSERAGGGLCALYHPCLPCHLRSAFFLTVEHVLVLLTNLQWLSSLCRAKPRPLQAPETPLYPWLLSQPKGSMCLSTLSLFCPQCLFMCCHSSNTVPRLSYRFTDHLLLAQTPTTDKSGWAPYPR